jgi:ribosome biogenesis GTPase A
MPEEVIMEFRRSQVDPTKAAPEILDLDTLLKLDQMQGLTS